jgi:dolichol-phosphate mannosyltransferase
MVIYVLCPIFNESQNIEELHRRLISDIKDHVRKFVFVDDGSSDKTVELINKFFYGTDFVVLGDGENYGPGYAFNLGFEWILNNSSNNDDVVLTIEADNTSDLKIFPVMIANCNLGYDLVLASVYAQGGGFGKTSFFRKVYSFMANSILRLVFDIKVLTLSSFYRLYKISLIKAIKEKNKDIITEPGFISMVEILIKAIKLEAKIIEVPMLLNSENRKGKSKMKIFKTILSYLRFLFVNKP